MAVQNLISTALPAEAKTEIGQKIAEIRAHLNFLITLTPAEKSELLKVGTGYAPFVEKAHNVVSAHPEIMSSLFSINEFKKDFDLIRDLTPIVNQLTELAEAAENTLFAVNSDAMTESLEVYAAVQQHKDKVPGLNTVVAEMQEFFKRTRKPKGQPVNQ